MQNHRTISKTHLIEIEEKPRYDWDYDNHTYQRNDSPRLAESFVKIADEMVYEGKEIAEIVGFSFLNERLTKMVVALKFYEDEKDEYSEETKDRLSSFNLSSEKNK